jgi:hypothetical protein
MSMPQLETSLLQAVEAAGGDIAAASREVGIPETTLRRKLKSEGLWERVEAAREGKAGGRSSDGLSEDPETSLSEIPIFHLDYSDYPSLHCYPLSDVHIGSPHFAEEVWDQWTNYLVNTPGVSTMLNGDGLNAALVSSVSDVYSEKLAPGEAATLLEQKLKPLADKGILDGITRGNHESRIWRTAGLDPLEFLADKLHVPYTPHAMVLVYHVGDQTYRMFVRHGTGMGAATVGSQANALERAARIIEADIFVSGHTHTQLAFPRDVFRWEPATGKQVPLSPGGRAYRVHGDRVERHKMMFVSSGSFLAYEPYAAERGYPPAHIGAPRVFMDGRSKDVHASV